MKSYKEQKNVEEKREFSNVEKKKYIRPKLAIYSSITEVTQNVTTGDGTDVAFSTVSG